VHFILSSPSTKASKVPDIVGQSNGKFCSALFNGCKLQYWKEINVLIL
jgi:hypothetical protein